MKLPCEPSQLQYFYQNELIKAGVCPQKAEQAAKSLTSQDLMLIGEIWKQWALILAQN